MRFIKYLGYFVATLVVLIGIAAVGVYVSSNGKLKKTFAVNVRALPIPTDAAAIAHGKHLAETRGCIDCHGKDLAGGKVIDDGAMGKLHAPNLTRGKGGRVANFKDEDWVRAIRHGIGPDGLGLFVMPSEEYSHLADDDLGALVAYLKTLPSVDRERPATALGPISRVLLAVSTGKMIAAYGIDHAHLNPQPVAKAATADYGRYLATACVGCHGPNYSGGKIDIGPPDWPPAANLTPHETSRLSKWSEGDFMATLRTAKRPDGTELNPVMPRGFGGMDEIELKALWSFFKTLPAAATGAR
jgi:cytochrome c553